MEVLFNSLTLIKSLLTDEVLCRLMTWVCLTSPLNTENLVRLTGKTPQNRDSNCCQRELPQANYLGKRPDERKTFDIHGEGY